MGILDSDSDDSSDESSSFVKKKPAPAAAKKSMFSSSSEDSSSKKKPPTPAPAAAKKKSMFSSSSEESSSKKKPPAAPAPAPKKSMFSSSSEESSSKKKPPAAPAPAPKGRFSSSDDDSSKKQSAPAPAKSRFSSSSGSGSSKKQSAPAPAPPPPPDKRSVSSSKKSGNTAAEQHNLDPAPESTNQQDAEEKEEIDSVSATRSAKSGKSKRSKGSGSQSKGSKSKKSQSEQGLAAEGASAKGSQGGSKAKSDGSQPKDGVGGGSEKPTSQGSQAGSQSAKQQPTEQSQSQAQGSQSSSKEAQSATPTQEGATNTGSPPEGSTYLSSKTPPPPPPVPPPLQGEAGGGESVVEEVIEDETLDSKNQPIVTTDSEGFLSEDSSLTHGTTKRQVIEEDGVVYEVIEEVILDETTTKAQSSAPPQQGAPSSKYEPHSLPSSQQKVFRIQQPPPRRQPKRRRGNFTVGFRSPHVIDLLEYRQALDAPLSVNVAVHVAKEYNEIPWYKQDIEEVPWYLQPDLYEEGALSELGEKVLLASEDGTENKQLLQIRAQRMKEGFKTPLVSAHSSPSSNTAQVDNRIEQTSGWLVDTTRRSSSLLFGPDTVSEGDSESSSGVSRLSKQRNFLTLSERPHLIPSTVRLSPTIKRRKARQMSQSTPQREYQRLSLEDLGPYATAHASNLRPAGRWSVTDSGYKARPGSKLLKSQSVQTPSVSEHQQPPKPRRATVAIGESQQNFFDQFASETLHQDQQRPNVAVSSKRHSIATMPSTRQTPKNALAAEEQPTTFKRPLTKHEYRRRVDELVRQNCPEESQNVDKMVNQFAGREKELIAMLENMGASERGTGPVVFDLMSSSSESSSESSDPGQAMPIYARVVAQRYSPKTPQPARKISPQSIVKLAEEDDESEISVPFDEPEPYVQEIFQDEYSDEGIRNRDKPKGQKAGGKRTKPRKTSRRLSSDAPQALRGPYYGAHAEGMVADLVIPNRSPIRRNLSGLSNVSSVSGYDGLHNVDGSPPPPPPRMAPEERARNPSMTVDIEELNDYQNGVSQGAGRPEGNGEGNGGVEGRRQSVTEELWRNSESQQKEVETFDLWKTLANNTLGITICLCLIAVWIVVLVVTFADTGSSSSPGEDGGSDPTPVPTAAPGVPVPTADPTPSTSAPVGTPQVDGVDGAELLPSYTWNVIQRDGDSPQWEAWEWLLDQDLDGYTDEELQQRFAVATFYFATNGADSSGGDPWIDADTHECTWYDGIICNAQDVVQQFDFRSNNLQGTVPLEMGMLTNLIRLDLGSNPQLQGTIPTTLGLLSSLQGLDLHDNDLTGTIPTELGRLSVLSWLTLASQKSGGSSGSTTGRNHGSGNRKLTGTIPTQFGLLSDLQHMRFESNRLTGPIPSELGNLTRLQTLVLRRNLLTGAIPPFLGFLQQLQGLALDTNQLTGWVPEELSRLQNLIELHLHDNQLGGQLPASLQALSNTLSWLTVSGNDFVGPLPASWSELSKLQVLQLEANVQLTGVIPVEWGASWTELMRIGLHETALTGEVPAGLCFLKQDNEFPLQTITVDCEDVTCTCGCECI